MRTTGRLVIALAATVMAPGVLYLILRTTGAAVTPMAALLLSAWPPSDPTPALRQLVPVAANPKARITPSMVAFAKVALAQDPLSFEPLFVVARAEEQAKRLDRATALLEEARRRRPSHPAIRMQLMIYYSQSERYDDLLAEVDWLLSYDEQLRDALLPGMVKMLEDKSGRMAVAALLSKNPAWRKDFLSVAAAGKIEPVYARELLALVSATKPGMDTGPEKQLVLESQIARGQYSLARGSALSELPPAQREVSKYVFDTRFRGSNLAKPFSWVLKDTEAGRAEFGRENGRTFLEISYFGGQNKVLAEQTLALSPGRYTLRSSIRSESTGAAGRLVWQIACQPAGSRAAELDVSRTGNEFSTLSTSFVIPASGCSGQSLQFLAEAGESVSPVSAQIAWVEVAQ